MEHNPQKNKLNIKALLSFIIFVLIITKEVLVNYYHVIPVRSLLNRQISYFVILPLWLIGLVLSIWVMIELSLSHRNIKRFVANINFWLALPILIDVGYFFIEFIFFFIRLYL